MCLLWKGALQTGKLVSENGKSGIRKQQIGHQKTGDRHIKNGNAGVKEMGIRGNKDSRGLLQNNVNYHYSVTDPWTPLTLCIPKWHRFCFCAIPEWLRRIKWFFH